MDTVYFPGLPANSEFPLARFLPPLESGSVARALGAYGRGGDLVLDPFGAEPHLAVEAAKEDRAVLVAASNPVQAFLIEALAAPLRADQLRAALGYLSSLPKNNTRMEPFLLDLYLTRCLHCGREVSAEYFIWDRDENQLVTKAYTCDGCDFAGEVMASEEDQRRADDYSNRGLQRSLALDRIVAADSPDRRGAADALDAYPPRALYAIVSILNKLDQVPPDEDILPAVRALLLSAFDAGNKLWGYPEGRSRPRQLVASPNYREINFWRALEQAVQKWSWSSTPNPVQYWQKGKGFQPGTITIFPGSMRDLIQQMNPDPVSMVLTVPPRPNQAFWTLGAMWSAWLWGKDRSKAARSALRRRRYDWNWHTSALRNVCFPLTNWLPDRRPILAFLPEAEPGFLAAALTAMAGNGYALQGSALRMEDQQAFLHWERSVAGDRAGINVVAQEAVTSLLEERNQPCGYPVLHGYTWCEMAARGNLASVWEEGRDLPLAQGLDALHSALDDSTVQRLRGGSERDRHVYWLKYPRATGIPFMDRIEATVAAILRSQHLITALDLESQACAALPGVLTPGRRMIVSCLQSYAVNAQGVWSLRLEDEEAARQKDVDDIRRRLKALGERLAYEVRESEDGIEWISADGGHHFIVQTSAFLGAYLALADTPGTFLVVPGGRARLLMEKFRRDPRADHESRVIKFRHIRRLDEEGLVGRDTFLERLAIDPPANQDPQLPLL